MKDLAELDSQIREKLTHYEIDDVVFSIAVNFEKGIIKEFTDLEDCEQYIGTRSEVSESLMLRWDVLVKLPDYRLPQRHTITFRVASRMRPIQMLEYVFSPNASDADRLVLEASPAFCRVDFINHLLGQEVVNLIDSWYEARRKSVVVSSTYLKLKKHRRRIADVIRYSIPILIAVLLGAAMFSIPFQGNTNDPISLQQGQILMIWLFASLLIIYLAEKIGFGLASRSFRAIAKFGQVLVFDLTGGDKNKQLELEQENQDNAKSFFWNAGIALAIDIAAGVLVAYLIRF